MIPGETEHEAEISKINAEIKEIEAQLHEIRPPQKAAEGEKPVLTPEQQKRDGLRKQLAELRTKKDQIQAGKKAGLEKLDKMKTMLSKMNEEQQKNKSAMKYRNEEEFNKAINDIEARIRGEKLSLNEEKRLVGEVNALKRQKKNIASLDVAKMNKAQLQEQMGLVRDANGKAHAEIGEIKEQENKIKAELDALRDREGIQEKIEKRKELKAQLDQLYTNKREAIAAFRLKKDAYYEKLRADREQQRERREQERLEREQERQAEAERRRKEMEEYEAARPAWEEEINACNSLIAYLQPLAPTEDKPQEETKKTTSGLRHKGDADEDNDRRKKKGGKKGKGGGNKKLKLPPGLFAQFEALSLSIPLTSADVPASLAALEAKREHFKNTPKPTKKTSSSSAATDTAAAAATPAAAAAATASESKRDEVDESKKPAEKYLTYDDDAAIGKQFPPLHTLKAMKGDMVEVGTGRPLVVMTWASFSDGDWKPVVCAMSQLAKQTPEADFLGLSCDVKEENVEKFIEKIGGSFPEISVECLEADFVIAFDPEKTVRTALQKLSNLSSLSASCVFLVDGKGTIVWREQFNQYHALSEGQFKAQLYRLLDGKDLIKNGNKPKGSDDEDEEEEMDLGSGSDDDGLLF